MGKKNDLVFEFGSFFKGANDLAKRLSPFFDELSEAVNADMETFKQVAERQRHASEKLAELGWFISGGFAYKEYAQVLKSAAELCDEEQIDQLLAGFYRERVAELAEGLNEALPARAFAIGPAIKAHGAGDYALSVPVFLSQAEGALKEKTEMELYSRGGHIAPQIKQYISSNMDEEGYFADSQLLVALCERRPFIWGRDERKKEQYSGFNRNAILHGLDKEYANEIYSLKALSLLAYVALGLDESLARLKAASPKKRAAPPKK